MFGSLFQTVAVRNEMCRVSVTSPRGPLYHRDCHYDGAICDEPLLPDPYESQYCFVRASRIKERTTDMQEKAKARLREYRLLAPSGRGGRVHLPPH